MLKKTLMVFPGQGTQYVGMGTKIHELPIPPNDYNIVLGGIGPKIWEQCFNEKYQHIAFKSIELRRLTIFVLNHFYYSSFINQLKSWHEDMVNGQYLITAGHSLGQCNSIVAANVTELNDMLQLVKQGSQYMDEVSKKLDGGLLALMWNDGVNVVEQIKRMKEKDGVPVYIALVNAPNQIVIGGLNRELELTKARLTQSGVKTYPLEVGGPIHTPIMEESANKLSIDILSTSYKPAGIPLIDNSSTQLVVNPEDAQRITHTQIVQPVEWVKVVEMAVKMGVERVIEFGEDQNELIRRMINRINRELEVLVVNSPQRLEQIVQRMQIEYGV